MVAFNCDFWRLFLASAGRGLFNRIAMGHESIAVCFALPEEAGPFQKQSGEIPVFFTGIGKANAEKAVREYLKDHSPGLLLTCGFAGGLDSGLNIGDVIFEATNGKGGQDDAMRSKLVAAGAKPAKIFCADRIAST